MSGFLSRWSQRKLAEKDGEALPPDPPPAPAALAGPPPAIADDQPVEAPAEEEFDLSTLPPIETLTAESDFSVFWKKGVPEALRQAALRRAWVADPVIRDYVSPLDYGWDFNTPGGLPPGFSDTLAETAEKVAELLRQAVGERDPEPPAPPEPLAVAEVPPEAEAEPEAEQPALLAEDAEQPSQEYMTVAKEIPAPRRRHGGALPT